MSGEGFQAFRRHLTEQAYRVVTALAPHVGLDRLEKVERLGMPGPAKVQHQFGKRRERFWQARTDGEAAEGSHEAEPMGFLLRANPRLPGVP